MILQDYPAMRAQQKANDIGLAQSVYQDEWNGRRVIAMNIHEANKYNPECIKLRHIARYEPSMDIEERQDENV